MMTLYRKPKRERRPLPQPPKDFDDIAIGKVKVNNLDKYNDDAFKEFNEKALEPCQFCGRTFLPDRLVVHLRSCGNQSSKGAAKRGKSKPASKTQTKFFENKQKSLKNPRRAGGTPTRSYREPPSLTCYICGRKYGTTSLNIHLKACKKKWQLEQMKLPKKERRKCPEPPKVFSDIPIKGKSLRINSIGVDSAKMQQYNEEAFKDWNDKVLEPCERCGRTFLPDRLIVHLRSCKGPKGSKAVKTPVEAKTPMPKTGKGQGLLSPARPKTAKPQRSASKSSVPMMPPGIICFICGRKYGTKSISIHLKACEKKFKREQKLLPKSQRRKLPKNDTDFDQIKVGGMSSTAMDEYNQDAFKQFNDEVLVPCERCGRTFLPDRLTVHLRSCKGPSKKQIAGGGGGPTMKKSTSVNRQSPERLRPSTAQPVRKTSVPKMPIGVI